MPKPIYALSFDDRLFLLSQKTFKQKLPIPLSSLMRLNMGAAITVPRSRIEIFAVWPHEPHYGVFNKRLGEAPAVKL